MTTITYTSRFAEELINLDTRLDVMPKFAALMKESMGADSFYARTRDVLEELIEHQTIHSNVDVTALVSKVLSDMSTGLTSNAMQTALSWVQQEKDLAVRKYQAGKEFELMDEEKELKRAQAKKIVFDSLALQAQTWRTYGKTLADPEDPFRLFAFDTSDPYVGIDLSRTTYENLNLGDTGNLLKQQLTESYAKLHEMTSKNVTEFGKWRFAYDDEGLVYATMEVGPVGPMSIPQYDTAVKNLDLMDSQLKTNQANIHKITAEAVTQYGRWTYDYSDLGLQSAAMVNGTGGTDGTVIPISDPTRANLIHQGNLLESQLVESYATIHKATAEVVTNFGRWTHDYTPGGLLSAAMVEGTGGSSATVEPLSDSQRIIAKEQAKGYAYNAWANSVSASAGMIGTVLASDQSPESLTSSITAFNASLNALRTVEGPYGVTP